MKSKLSILLVLAMVLSVFAGCASSTGQTPLANGEPESTPMESSLEEDPTDGATPAPKTIYPLSVGVDVNALNDCTVAVSFAKGDAYVDDAGQMQLKVTVYAYDTYDMVDVAGMQVGDTIVLCGQSVAITALETDQTGALLINGGLDEGGYELVTDDDTVYYADDFDDLKLYYALGEATIPVSGDFQFEDSSDLEAGVKTYCARDFLSDEAGIVYSFAPYNTSITISDGCVVAMQRVYNP